MNRMDYEWKYFIGGDMALARRKYGGNIAFISHFAQGSYEAFITRKGQDPWSVGIVNDSNEAQNLVEQALESLWEK